MEKLVMALFVALVAAIVIYGVIFIAGLFVAPVVMFAWNYTMPFLFSLPVIGYWHAFWLYIFASCLIKSTQTNTQKDRN